MVCLWRIMPERTPNQFESLKLVCASMQGAARFIVGHYIDASREFDTELETWLTVRDYSKEHDILDLPDPFGAPDDCHVEALDPGQEAMYQRHPYLLHRDDQGRIVHLLEYSDSLHPKNNVVQTNFTIPLE